MAKGRDSGIINRFAEYTYTLKKQYDIGIEAGKDLAKMHTYEAPRDLLPWHERAMKKHRKYLEHIKHAELKLKMMIELLSL